MYTEEKLKQLGIELAPVSRAGQGVVPIRRYEDLLFVSGHGPVDENGEALMRGRVGVELTPEEGYEAARLCAVSMLRSVKDYHMQNRRRAF